MRFFHDFATGESNRVRLIVADYRTVADVAERSRCGGVVRRNVEPVDAVVPVNVELVDAARFVRLEVRRSVATAAIPVVRSAALSVRE